jgi:inward rectifier potassium channel
MKKTNRGFKRAQPEAQGQPNQAQPGESPDLGFGYQIGPRIVRLINKDGSFNVRRTGSGLGAIHPYQFVITMSWWKFWLWVSVSYVALNAVFAGIYLLIGLDQLSGTEVFQQQGLWSQFSCTFFFSVQTFTSVGYGSISPVGLGAGYLSSLEAMVGLLSFALATGALFGRFARPSAKLAFSPKAIISPYQDHHGLMFRMVNRRASQLINLTVQVTMTYYEWDQGDRKQQFRPLTLERKQVTLFPLSWTVVHPIGPDSPLYQKDEAWLAERHGEFLIVLQAYDDTFAQDVHVRTSYRYDEMLWGARFKPMFHAAEDGMMEIAIDEVGTCEPAPKPTTNGNA